jgi:O-antigen/teichoic acid export membrane protein
MTPAAPAPAVGDILDSPEATRVVIRGSVLRSVVYLLTLLANVGALALLFRHLGVENSGRYVTVLTVCTLVGAIVETAFGAISVREYARSEPHERHSLMADLIAVRGAALVLSALLALAFLAAAGYPAVIVAGTAVGVVGALFEALSSTYSVSLTRSLRLGAMAALQIARQGMAVIATIGLIALDAPLFYFFLVLTVAGAAQLTGALFLTRSQIPHLPAMDWTRSKELLRASGPFIVAMALSVLYFRIAMILMPVLSSEAETGYLGVPFRLLEIVTLVSVLVLSSAFPIVARAASNDRARHRYALLRMTEVSVIVGLYVGVMGFVAAPLIVRVLGGDEFSDAAGPLRILSVSLAAKFVLAAWSFSLLSLDRSVAVLRANALATVLALILTLALVPLWGAIGGATATAFADGALLIGYAWALHRSPEPVELPWRRFGILLVVGLVASATFLLPAPVIAQAAIASMLYGLTVWRAGMIPDELVHALPFRRRG